MVTNTLWQRDLSISYQRIGEIEQAQGNLSAALKSSEDSLEILKKLVVADPDNFEWLRDVTVSYEQIINIERAQGKLASAIERSQKILGVRREVFCRS